MNSIDVREGVENPSHGKIPLRGEGREPTLSVNFFFRQVFGNNRPVYAGALIMGVGVGALASPLTAATPRGLRIFKILQRRERGEKDKRGRKRVRGGLPALAEVCQPSIVTAQSFCI